MDTEAKGIIRGHWSYALIDMLVAKGIITHEELHAKILEIKQKQGIVLSGG